VLVHFVRPDSIASWLDSILPHAERGCAAFGAGFVLILGLYIASRRKRSDRGA